MTLRRLGFICGMPRSGSSWLGRALAAHPEIAVFGETDYWGRDYMEPGTNGQYDSATIHKLVRVQTTKDWESTTGDTAPLPLIAKGDYARLVMHLLTGSTPGPQVFTPNSFFVAIARQVAGHTGKGLVVEKTPGHLLFLGRIRAAFPDAPIVVIKREPLGFIASLVHRPPSPGLGSNQRLRRFAYHPAIIVYLWRGYARSLLEQLSWPDPRTLCLDYSEINRDPVDVARRVARHLGGEDQSWLVDARPVNSSFAAASRRPPPAATGFWLRLLAGRECGQLYPELQLTGTSVLTIAWSCFALPLAAGLFLLLYRPRSSNFWRYLRQFAQIGTRLQKDGGALRNPGNRSSCA